MKHMIAAVLLGLLFAGCAPQEPPPTSIKPIDQSVVVTVKMNLKTDAELAVADLDVKAENGLLVLRGKVTNEEAKKRAEDIAAKSAKVENVASHIEVVPE